MDAYGLNVTVYGNIACSPYWNNWKRMKLVFKFFCFILNLDHQQKQRNEVVTDPDCDQQIY